MGITMIFHIRDRKKLLKPLNPIELWNIYRIDKIVNAKPIDFIKRVLGGEG